MSAKSGFTASAFRNSLSSRAMTRHWVFAVAVALRGDSLIAPISPKISPALTLPMTLPLATSVTSPSISRYILSRLRKPAFSFSSKNLIPAAALSGLPPARKNSRAMAAL